MRQNVEMDKADFTARETKMRYTHGMGGIRQASLRRARTGAQLVARGFDPKAGRLTSEGPSPVASHVPYFRSAGSVEAGHFSS
jgi:hypothetical protein